MEISILNIEVDLDISTEKDRNYCKNIENENYGNWTFKIISKEIHSSTSDIHIYSI